MLPRINRLKKKKEIERTFQRGRGFKEDPLFLKVSKNNLTISRFVFIVGRKAAKKAVTRNKIKRRLRELAKKRLPEIRPGFDVAMVVLPGAENKDFSQLQTVVNKLLKKAGLLN